MKIYFPGGKKVFADFNGFTHQTDQSPQGGGEGKFPETFSLFLASIGTCAGIYVLGFCQQRNIDTTGIELRQSHEFNPSTRLIEKIHLEIKLPSGFPEKYSDALIRVAKMCTVKKHLENPPKFKVDVEFE